MTKCNVCGTEILYDGNISMHNGDACAYILKKRIEELESTLSDIIVTCQSIGSDEAHWIFNMACDAVKNKADL